MIMNYNTFRIYLRHLVLILKRDFWLKRLWQGMSFYEALNLLSAKKNFRDMEIRKSIAVFLKFRVQLTD